MATEDTGRRARPRGRLAAALALVLAAGCGGESGPTRLPISGRVTLDGRPLDAGAITFLPSGPGPAVGGRIEGGAFALGRPEGPGPGGYKVEIVSVQPTGKQIKSPDDPTATIEEVRNLIPPRYNLATTLVVEVKPEGENTYQFDLTSRDDSPRGRRVAGSGSRDRRRSPGRYVE